MILPFFFFLIMLYSCTKDYFNFEKLSKKIETDHTFALPIIHSKLIFRDIIRDYNYEHLFEEDETNLLYLIYSDIKQTDNAENIIFIPDQTLNIEYSSNEFITSGFPIISPITISKDLSYVFTFQEPGDKIDTIVIKNALFKLEINSSFNCPGFIKFIFNDIVKNGNPYIKEIAIGQDGNYNTTYEYTDLDGYKIILDDNHLNYKVEYTLYSDNCSLPNNVQTTITINFLNLSYKIIWGKIAEREIFIKDTVEIEFFKNAEAGNVYFVDPKLFFTIGNSYGNPFELSFLEFKTYSTIYQDLITRQLPPEYQTVFVNYPFLPIEYAKTNIILDTLSYPEIRDVIYHNPKKIFFNLKARLLTSNKSFILDTSRIIVNSGLRFSLIGKTNPWILKDTLNFDFSKILTEASDNNIQDTNFEYLKFNIIAINKSPTEVKLQVYFTDSLYNIIDSLFNDSYILKSGVTDENGKVIESFTKKTQTTFTQNRIKNLKDTKKAIIKVLIVTTNNGNKIVRIYSTDYVELKVSLMFNVKN